MTRHTHPLLVLLALATGGFAIGTTEFATMSLLPFIQSDMAISPSTASHVISVYALGVVIGAPVITVLAARIDRKWLLLALMGLFAIGNGLSAVASDYGSLILFRFISGLPHGAYFGLAALMAASVVSSGKRTRAVGMMMMGLTVATIVGVPLATWLGNVFGWRFGFWLVTALALLTVVMIALFAPKTGVATAQSAKSELRALSNSAVLLTLAIGAIGFGGMFAVYTYLTATLDHVTHMSAHAMPLILAIFGLGMTVGNVILPRFADRSLMPTAGGLLLWSAAALAAFPLVADNPVLIAIDVFCIGMSGALGTILQTRLMDVAGEAQNLAAALNHVAFNMANALGPWLAGLALAFGFGYRSTGVVGCCLALGGLAIWAVARRQEKRQRHAAA
ncbi:MFS transporter [Larsenimonas rhizosphaerae]|uniref:MFS transporter n=1 Tax=Larsenimonas rhizosphaerae TaxID=2944682 RepID=A0AA41ZFB4_9GAMM|nr:MFS transporter [Larsenimonas rhizosphaerae]MCM2129578.1 MFS transporter [Larsenimonas rhizosphaerae]MCX2524237.1 MFS transporter [Larsenimonas rhizosphaerae]